MAIKIWRFGSYGTKIYWWRSFLL